MSVILVYAIAGFFSEVSATDQLLCRDESGLMPRKG